MIVQQLNQIQMPRLFAAEAWSWSWLAVPLFLFRRLSAYPHYRHEPAAGGTSAAI
jgi:hypothetical protein